MSHTISSLSVESVVPPKQHTRTLKALVNAGQRLISEGRMDAATIDDIALVADVSKRSFHNHFTDKEALVVHVLNSVRADLEAKIALVNTGVDDLAVNLARGMLVSFRYGMDNQLGQRVMLQMSRGVADPAAQRNHVLVGNLQKGVAKGTFKLASVDAGLVLVLALSDLGLAQLLRLRDERQHARQLMYDICVLLLRGLGVDARRLHKVAEDALRVVIDAPTLDPQTEARWRS